MLKKHELWSCARIVNMGNIFMVSTSFDALTPQVSSAHWMTSPSVMILAKKIFHWNKIDFKAFWRVRSVEISTILQDFGNSSYLRFIKKGQNLMLSSSFDALRSQVSNAHRMMCLFCILFAKKIFLWKSSSNMNALK